MLLRLMLVTMQEPVDGIKKMEREPYLSLAVVAVVVTVKRVKACVKGRRLRRTRDPLQPESNRSWLPPPEPD
jgi:hypothetical protein